jgi:hypothetical protein
LAFVRFAAGELRPFGYGTRDLLGIGDTPFRTIADQRGLALFPRRGRRIAAMRLFGSYFFNSRKEIFFTH